MNTNTINLDDFDAESQRFFQGMQFLDLDRIDFEGRKNQSEDAFSSIRINKSFEEISNEIAMRSPSGKDSLFFTTDDGNFIDYSIDRKYLVENLITYSNSKSKLKYNLIHYHSEKNTEFIIDNNVLNVKTELNTLEGEIDFTKKPKFSYRFDINNQTAEFKVYYEFTKFKNSADYNRYALILTFNKYVDLELFFNKTNKELQKSSEDDIKIEFNKAFTKAKGQSEVLDFLYETAPYFVLLERKEEDLFSDLKLLANKSIDNIATNENISILNIIKNFKNKKWFFDSINQDPNIIRVLWGKLSSKYIDSLIVELSKIGNAIWKVDELEEAIPFYLDSNDEDANQDNFIDSRIAYWCGYLEKEKKYEVGFTIHQYEKTLNPIFSTPRRLGVINPYTPLQVFQGDSSILIPAFVAEYFTNEQLKEDKEITLNNIVALLLPETSASTRTISTLSKLFRGKKIKTVEELIEFLNKIDETVKATELEEYGIEVLFRGTTRNAQGELYLGNLSSIDHGTSTSTDPVRAVIFGIESSSKRDRIGFLQVFVPRDLEGLNLQAPNAYRYDLELEVIIKTSPEELSNFAVVEIPIQDARKLVEEVYGISLDTRMDRSNADIKLVETKKLTPREALEFYKKVVKLKK